MDKLDIPIPGQERPLSYRNTTILFTWEAVGVYRMTVGSPNQIANWRSRSRRLGALFRMRGGREFGGF
jgi:hypothetical protein